VTYIMAGICRNFVSRSVQLLVQSVLLCKPTLHVSHYLLFKMFVVMEYLDLSCIKLHGTVIYSQTREFREVVKLVSHLQCL